jgi:ISXO2-like transposase domain/Transposase zinc-ribbon domain
MPDSPRSLTEFERRFGDEDTCAEYLAAARWPDGFVCPGCGGSKAWRLESKPWTYECARCSRQTSVTAGTILHHSKLPLTTWFWAAFVMATQPNGISALQLQRELALGSYKTAWLLCAKLRHAMVAPGRSPLSGLVEIDKTEITGRSKNDPTTGGESSHQGKIPVVGAVEVRDLRSGRIRLTAVPDDSAASLHAFLAANLAPVITAHASGEAGYCDVAGINHDPHLSGALDPQKVRPRVHRIFSDLKVWASSVYHGLRRKHLQSYLDEFVFRFNRRRNRSAAFFSLLGIAAAHQPLTYGKLVSLGA